MRSLFLLILCLASTSARACLWDYDTLRDERRGLPGVAEILAGRFERHSAFFYADRVERMNALLAREPANLDAWDNRAVAYAKLGQLDEAIATIKKKDAIAPDQYTTHSNLGTFEMFAGDLPAAVAELKRALEINPNAHFGREKYQLQLATFLLAKQRGPGPLGKTFISLVYPPRPPLPPRPSTKLPADVEAFRAAIDQQRPAQAAWAHEAQQMRDAWVADREHAIAGIVGMIRFGTNQSPELFAALGELLADRRDAHLAYRAFLRARDLGFDDPGWLTTQMGEASEMTADKSEFDDGLIGRERADAEAWVAAYQCFEDDLIRAGKNPDDESLVAPFYAKRGPATEPVGALGIGDKLAAPAVRRELSSTPWGLIGAPIFGTLTAWWFVDALRRRVRRHRAIAAAAGVS